MLEELREANSYITSKIKETDSVILEMEKFAQEQNVPIVTKEVAEYLKFMVKMNKSKNILEIGTAIGYSGTIMAKAVEEYGGHLTTIEIDEERFNQAKENFAKAKVDNVTLILGDGLEEIKKLQGEFDFIFIDAAKGKYKEFFEDSYKLLSKDGIIFIDNIMFRGYLYKEYPKRFKTIVRKLNEFIDYLYENYPGFTLLPFGDGIGLLQGKK
ncbi:O-methyltransferase [Ilyobacter polytropus]|uniref:tRNA 5-hydroxyuridine methyltransferase n=1 Tax=Ilyobacter polytropus (strain ATCC 51220 / DSM 2926 / LMG 16218 / CuHBu1) TaxID=572544 RepID=E3H772_ILYPC|nr:O-methyltransferase [Ilyobacter polytropus]ADO82553.1 O-methyltransferase family 3 [Ilyobacter polytropus DSM 2926]